MHTASSNSEQNVQDSSPQPSEEAIDIRSPTGGENRTPTVADGTESQTKPFPIPNFPKPMAQSYRNIKEYFPAKYTYADGEQMMVINTLICEMCYLYFPKPRFGSMKLPIPSESLIRNVAVDGTIYRVVVVNKNESVTKHEQLLGVSAEVESMKSEFGREDSVFSRDQTPMPGSSMVLLIAIVTKSDFWKRQERFVPSILHFSGAVVAEHGRIQVGGQNFQRGHVIIVGGQGKRTLGEEEIPARPTFEFYTFDAGTPFRHPSLATPRQPNSSSSRLGRPEMRLLSSARSRPAAPPGPAMIPWFGGLSSGFGGFETNSFSFADEDAEKVHQMLQGIVNCAGGDRALSPHVSSYVTQQTLLPGNAAQIPEIPSTYTSTPSKVRTTVKYSFPASGHTSAAQDSPILAPIANMQTEVPVASTIQNGRVDPVITYLQGLIIIKSGRLIRKNNGRLLPAEEQVQAKRLALSRDFTFALPKQKVRRDRGNSMVD